LTALSVYLAVIIKQSHNIQPPGNSQLTLAISEKQTLNILQFVLSLTYPSSLPVDPRLHIYQNSSSTSQSDPDKNENVLFLKELLSQMGMELDLSKKNASNNSENTKLSAPPESTQQGIIYYPRSKPFKLKVLNDQYSISILPIDAKPNINYLSVSAMEHYLAYLGIKKDGAKQLSHTLADWIDTDDFTSDYGAELGYYLKSEIPYTPRNAPVRDWGELYYVKYITPDIIALLKNNFVLAGNHKTIAAKYSTPEIISALANIPLEASKKYFSYHQGKLRNVSLMNLLSSSQIEAINSIAQWESREKDILLVQISSSESRIEGIFNTKEKKIYSWRFIASTDGSN
jgi:hypothetical protein